MKKMLKIILIIILFKGSLIAQKSDVPDYYNLINQAELSICDSDLAKALVLYDSAFQSIENKIPYYKDVYNALISAIEKNDDTSILKYWDALCKQGLDSAFINGSQKINALRDKTYWRKLENDMNLYHKEKDARYLFLCEVINDDQKIRKEYDARRIGNKYVVFRDTIMFVDSLNYIRLITDFNTNGFPDDNVAINFNPFNHPVYYYVLEHNAMWNRIWMDAAILKNIDSLRFHPLLYTKLMDYHNDQFVKGAERMYGTNYHAIYRRQVIRFFRAIRARAERAN
ncbi:MAG: hypothetical protein H6575_08350 [Lewinellaceae bacterium]|nr:hypothetical protein [Lewinellaceae bacterium]